MALMDIMLGISDGVWHLRDLGRIRPVQALQLCQLQL